MHVYEKWLHISMSMKGISSANASTSVANASELCTLWYWAETSQGARALSFDSALIVHWQLHSP